MSYDVENKRSQNADRRRRLTAGLILIAIGAMFMLAEMDWFDLMDMWHFWPAIIALIGVVKIVEARDASQFSWGCFQVFLGMWLYASIEHVWGWTFSTSWPLVLIAFGVCRVASGLMISLFQPTNKEGDK